MSEILKGWLKKSMLPLRFHKLDARPSGTIESILHPTCQNESNSICPCQDTDPHLPYQDYWLKPPWKTLAYGQAIQYWVEEANLLVPGEPYHLAMSVHELRWCMRRYTTFSDHDGFEGLAPGLPEAEVEETTQPNPIEPVVADSPAVLVIVPSVLENISAALIATPATSKEESVTHVTISAALADEPANPPTPLKTSGYARSPTESEYLRWVKVHSSIQQP